MRAVEWNSVGPAVRVVDQRRLPSELACRDLATVDDVAAAIRDMIVRGAPTLGATAGFGLALAGHLSTADDLAGFQTDLERAAAQLRAARPTAVNLPQALDRLMARVAVADSIDVARAWLLLDAQQLANDEVARNRLIGQHGAALLADGDTVLHHCHTGALAAVDFGTALGVLRTAHEQGKRLTVLVDETRPRLQGARLTAWELQRLGIAFEVIPDTAAGHYLQRGEVQAVFVGADRVAANGDVANKIGTYMLALAANANQVPFYSAFPSTTIDLSCPDGTAIPIEDRSPDEVLCLNVAGDPVFPAGVAARNPAFDVTPHALITALITEHGVLRPPFGPALRRAAVEGVSA
ncbi:MAG: S-methyl-5-thioribose-1-phosphate isomerase [Chloroflexi bacterium]|nr:S-methyl-5-thioribose-1-phosphate isomerase [Chloroflexota bacterium]